MDESLEDVVKRLEGMDPAERKALLKRYRENVQRDKHILDRLKEDPDGDHQ